MEKKNWGIGDWGLGIGDNRYNYQKKLILILIQHLAFLF